MCYVWQHPSNSSEEVSLDTLKKIPSGIDYLNLTGGEPTLRRDLAEIVDLLYPKAMTLEISSNGLNAKRLEPIILKYPCIKIRFSIEGCESTNNKIRGERAGYRKKTEGLLRLKKLGGKDLGFSMVIQDDNAEEAVELFRFARRHGFEFATTTLHNGFQFHKSDNFPYDRMKTARHIGLLIEEMLKGINIKNWFRSYFNLGLMGKVLGNDRILSCTAGSDLAFVDPWGDVYACNVRPEFKLGNLGNQEWNDIWGSDDRRRVIEKVKNCEHNCWMVGSAKIAMRNPKYPKLPKFEPLRWVLYNKVKIMFGGKIRFQNYLDFNNIYKDKHVTRRQFFLDKNVKRTLQKKDEPYYKKCGEIINR
jgi:MoaA/NifB/PqqE/SkfB family radical SAM enzyme